MTRAVAATPDSAPETVRVSDVIFDRLGSTSQRTSADVTAVR
ncbi:hypothetical protein ABZ614_39960 [Streptomyces sp. NPDC013178]